MTAAKRTAVYSGLTAKRYFKLFPFVLAVTVLLVAALGIVLRSMLSESGNNVLNNPVTIAVTGDVDDVYLEIALNAVENVDLTRYSMKLPVMSEDEAREKFRAGEISGYIVIPKDFMKEARAGNVGNISYVTSDGSPSLSARYTSEMTKTISSLVLAAQKATYGYENFALDRGMSYDELVPKAKIAVVRYVNALVNRGTLFSVRETGFSGASTEEDSLVAGIVTVMLFLWGVSCCTVASKKDERLMRSLRAKGVGAGAQIAAEYAAYLFFFAVTAAVIAVITAVTFSFVKVDAGIALDAKSVLCFASFLQFPVLVVSSMQFFLYEATRGITNGVLAQFVTGVLMGFLSGCLFPPHFFPEAAQKIGGFLPTGVVRLFLSKCESGAAPPASCIVAGTVYFAVFIALSVILREKKIKGEEAE